MVISWKKRKCPRTYLSRAILSASIKQVLFCPKYDLAFIEHVKINVVINKTSVQTGLSTSISLRGFLFFGYAAIQYLVKMRRSDLGMGIDPQLLISRQLLSTYIDILTFCFGKLNLACMSVYEMRL